MLRAVVLSLLISFAAFGQATRTWVSGVGDDAHPCSRTAPCKTWAGAISKTAAGGEIDALDPGGYGPVTITKSLTLAGTGVLASTINSGINGITISAAGTDNVVIRNLAIQGVGTGLNGINYLAAASVTVENCQIQGLTNTSYGINVNLTAAGSLIVRNTDIMNAGGGIRIQSTTGAFTASLSRVNIRQAGYGVWASYGNISITNSVLSQLTTAALLTDGTGKIFASSNLISGNAIGASAATGTTIEVSNNDVVDNAIGFSCAGTGAIKTATNNRKADNLGGGSECTPASTITVQ